MVKSSKMEYSLLPHLVNTDHFQRWYQKVYERFRHLAMGQNRGTLVNIKIGGKWMFINPNMAP